jgi:purine-binding chemotaxis protein CheW
MSQLALRDNCSGRPEELSVAEIQNATEPFILFELAGTTYALRSRLVQQMEMIEHITPVPNAPPFVEGVVFARGQVVPAVNLRQRFGFDRIPHDLRTRLVVVSIAGRSVGLVVDAAREFVNIPADAIQPPPAAGTGLSGKYLQCIVRLGDRLVLVLDIDEVLNFSDFSVPAPHNI